MTSASICRTEGKTSVCMGFGVCKHCVCVVQQPPVLLQTYNQEFGRHSVLVNGMFCVT